MAKYEAAFPRQMWDVDVLAAQMADQEQFRTLAEYGRRRYAKEEAQRDREPEEGGPWAGIQQRLGSWAPLTEPQWVSIERFQSSQMTRAARRPRDHWAARVARLRLLCRLLAADRYATWKQILAAEQRIPDRPQGTKVKQTRNRVASVTGAPPKSLGQYPRRAFWEHLAQAHDLNAALSAFETALV